MRRFFYTCFLILLLIRGASAEEATGKVEDKVLQEAAAKALRIVEKSQRAWYEQGQTCTSCHHQTLPILVASAARQRGVMPDAELASEVVAKSFAHLRDLDAIVQGQMYIDDIDDGWRLVAAHEAGVPPSTSTAAIAQFLAGAQRNDGGWATMDARPPQSYGRFTVTAIAARGAGYYLPDQERKKSMLDKARQWLLKAEPRSTEERTFQLLGLLWTGAEKETRQQNGKQLLALQNVDGGWSELPGMSSDAYTTGEVLYALHQSAGLATNEPSYQRGLGFLLKSQQPDGSWRVESRLHPSIPVSPKYFNAGFPHGRRHQFISIMGTGLATLALLQATSPPPGKTPSPPVLPDLSPAEKQDWIRVAISGSAAELKKSLDGGLKANEKTAHGTTLLMLSAHDPEKVRLLLDRGADVHMRAESGFDALTIAARHRGNAESVRLLLKQGARPNAEKDAPVRNSASPLFFAAAAGDVESIRALAGAGAAHDHRMLVVGSLPMTPLMAATLRADNALAEALISGGADPNFDEHDTPLGRAVINNHPETVKLLLAKGAKVNRVDKLGMTPLLYAATVHFGDTTVLELLLAAGADPQIKNAQGRTALDLAKENKHKEIESILSGRKLPP